MGVKRRLLWEIMAMKRLFLALALGAGLLTSFAARAEETEADRAARWHDLQQAIFGDKQLQDGQGILQLEAPVRALDAALVPITITLTGTKAIKGVYLVIDDNPSPLAAHVTFGPAADPHLLKLRVRVNQYTQMHAVAETADGQLYEVMKFVKAAGGCSAPAGSDDAVALKDIGRMKLRLLSDFTLGKPVQAQLMIRHPNFNGMQMDQVTRQYTPAHFIQSADVSYNGQLVFHLDSDISLSTDPVIGFDFVPQDKGLMKVDVHDSENLKFSHSFEIPEHAS
jgi:sulfur-oxidizing protein SoxY